jgi:hypothetical protein
MVGRMSRPNSGVAESDLPFRASTNRRGRPATKQPDGQITQNASSFVCFCFTEIKIDSRQYQLYVSRIPFQPEGRLAIVTKRGAGCGGRGRADNERRGCGRRSRVVLTHQCWRQVPRKLALPGVMVAQHGHQGERV